MDNPTDQHIYGIIRRNLKEGRPVTVLGVAADAEVSRSTIYRFARHLGYATWQECITHLTEFHAPRTDNIEIDYGVLAEAIQELRGGIVLVDAVGDAEICREHLIERLGRLGIITLPYAPATCEQLSSHGVPGLAFVINESGFVLSGTCRVCRRCGYKIVAITANETSLVAQTSDLCICIGNKKSSLQNYEPNLFAASALIVLERMAARLEALLLEEPPSPA